MSSISWRAIPRLRGGIHSSPSAGTGLRLIWRSPGYMLTLSAMTGPATELEVFVPAFVSCGPRDAACAGGDRRLARVMDC